MSRRKYFQLHLSTAVVLMCVAGALGWANVRGRIETEKMYGHCGNETSDGSLNNYYDADYEQILRGWPFNCKSDESWYRLDTKRLADKRQLWWIKHGVYNSLIALAILLTVWQLCEWRIRRREAK